MRPADRHLTLSGLIKPNGPITYSQVSTTAGADVLFSSALVQGPTVINGGTFVADSLTSTGNVTVTGGTLNAATLTTTGISTDITVNGGTLISNNASFGIAAHIAHMLCG